MTDREKILVKIESMLSETTYEPYTDEVFGKIQALKELKSYIESMQEKSVNEELEEAAKNHAAERFRVTRDRELAEKCKWSFKAGAKWQEEKDNEEKVLIYKHGFDDCKKLASEDSEKELPKIWDRETLDEYAYQVAYDLSNDWMRETPTWDDVEMACKLGAQWYKKKLLNKSNGMYPCKDEEGDLVGYSIYYEAEGAYGEFKNVVVID